MDWIAVADVATLRPGTMRRVLIGSVSLALVCTSSSVFVMDDACSHRGGRLSDGEVDGTLVRCRRHGFQFEVPSGRCTRTQAQAVRMFDTKVERGKVWVRAMLA